MDMRGALLPGVALVSFLLAGCSAGPPHSEGLEVSQLSDRAARLHDSCPALQPDEEDELAPDGGGTESLDLGVAPNYAVDLDADYDFSHLREMGVRRVNLYFQWKDFEKPAGGSEPDTDWARDIDPIVEKLARLGMRCSFIVHLTDTDCTDESPKSAWTDYGVPPDIEFTEFDHEPLRTRAVSFMKEAVGRYDPAVVTHVFLGNETDQFLRLYPEHAKGFVELMQAIRESLPETAVRSRFGTTFTVNPDRMDLAASVAAEVEVMGFTIYPFLEASFEGRKVPPTSEAIARWFGAAESAAGRTPLAVTETAHPSAEPLGSPEEQKRYAERLVAYLRANEEKYEFVSWWSLWDSTELREDGDLAPFRHLGLLTYPEEERKPAFDVWIGGLE